MKGLIAISLFLIGSAQALACRTDDFFADVLLWGESKYAGLVFNACGSDADLKLRVRIYSKNFAPLATATVKVSVPAGGTAVFDGQFPRRKMNLAVPDNRRVWVIASSIVSRPASTAEERMPGLPAEAFAEMAAVVPHNASE